MTKLPQDSWAVQGIVGPKYPVGPTCSAPGCTRWADHAHHIWRRSFLGGPYRWVKLEDGTIVANLTGLCARHHEEITENLAAIHRMDSGLFVWMDDHCGEFVVTGMLSPQPGVHDHVDQEEEDACPTCGHVKRRLPELPPGEKRKRKSWSVMVPDDEEDGAAVLDELEAEVATVFGIDHYANIRNRRYFSIAQAFALVLQESQMLRREK